MNKNEILETLFDVAWMYEHSMDYMIKIGNDDTASIMSWKFEGVKSVIEDLDLEDEYEQWKEKEGLK